MLPRSVAIGLVGNVLSLPPLKAITQCVAPIGCDRISWKRADADLTISYTVVAPIGCDRISWKL